MSGFDGCDCCCVICCFITGLGASCGSRRSRASDEPCSFTSTCLMIGFALALVWGLTGLFSIPP